MDLESDILKRPDKERQPRVIACDSAVQRSGQRSREDMAQTMSSDKQPNVRTRWGGAAGRGGATRQSNHYHDRDN